MNKAFFCVSIDVECDMPRWVVEPETTLRNLRGIAPLQAVFDRHGVKPTYLVTHPVASDPASVELFGRIRESGRCEVGMHCHPWTTPPVSGDERLVASFLSNMPDEVVRLKLETLTERIRSSFGVEPVSYRAGRYGLAPSHLRMLEELGYRVDTSVTPLVSWSEQGGPDFRDARALPYFPSYRDASREGNARVLEVPVTVALTRLVPDWARRLYVRIPRVTHLRGLLSRDRLDVIDVLWVYPALFTVEEMVKAADMTVASGAPVVNMFMHSNEVWPGESPYSKTEADVAAYLERLDLTLTELIGRRGLVPCTLGEFWDHFTS